MHWIKECLVGRLKCALNWNEDRIWRENASVSYEILIWSERLRFGSLCSRVCVKSTLPICGVRLGRDWQVKEKRVWCREKESALEWKSTESVGD